MDIGSEVLDLVVKEWPEVSDDRVKVTRYGDEVHIAILEGGVGGPFPGEPLYLAPRRQDVRVRLIDVKFDRTYVEPPVEGAQRIEMINLHLQRSERGSNLLVGWRAYASGRPRKTFDGLLRRVTGVYDVHDHLPELIERDSLEVMIHHEGSNWRHWLVCKNGDDIPFLPATAEQFLRSVFGQNTSTLHEAFLNPRGLEYGCRLVLPEEYSSVLESYHQAIERAEAQLLLVQDVVTGKASRRMKLPR